MKTTQHVFVLAAIACAFSWFFGAVLFQDRSFGFRDAANFYYPLFEWESQEWRAGRIPLWNPLDDTGTPVFAETTSSVLYPGKLVFALPISFRLRYHIYVTMHVLLAAATAYALARRWQASVPAAGLAALAYGFGGSVVFQYCNVVFLVGAAWLPAALLAADWMLMRRSLIGAVTLGVVLALMTLGGDPQAALHAGLLAAIYAWFSRRHDEERAPYGCWRQHALVLLGCAACSGFLLAAVQILPAMESASRSDRAAFDHPRSLMEVASCVSEGYTDLGPYRDVDLAAQIIGDPAIGTHLRHVYHFSVGPWHVAEFLWPNCFGKAFPRNERWVNRLPAEGRTWTPSAYLGLLPLLLAALTLSGWRVNWQVRFLVLVAVLSLLGSFGWYGLGWILQELRAAFSGGDVGEPWIGNPVGGVYWLLVVMLPGYVMFRYPAKLLVLTTLAVSLLAARGWDRYVREVPSKLSRAALLVAGLSLAMAAAFGLLQPVWRSWLAEAPPDSIFGPLDTTAATSRVLTALAHTAACGLLIVVVLQRVRNSARGYLLLAMTAIELCLANAWMTSSISSDVWTADVWVEGEIAIAEGEDTAPPPRLYRDPNATLLPAEWSQQTADNRLDEVVAWERAGLLPRHHLSRNVAVIGAHTSLRSLDTAALLRVRQRHARQTQGKHAEALLAPLSVGYRLTGAKRTPLGGERMNSSPADGIELSFEPHAYPRVWLASSAVMMDLLPAKSRRQTDERTRDIFLKDAQPRDLRSVVFIEAASGQRLPTDLPALSHDDDSRFVLYGPQQVVVEARTSSGAWLVLNDTFFPGWEATREANGQRFPLTIYRANRLMRAVLLPPGEHRVEFVYRPRRFWTGAIVSGFAWIAVCGLAISVGLVRVARTCSVCGNLSKGFLDDAPLHECEARSKSDS